MKARRDFQWNLTEVVLKLAEGLKHGKHMWAFVSKTWQLATWRWHCKFTGGRALLFLVNKTWLRVLNWEEAIYSRCHRERDTSVGNGWEYSFRKRKLVAALCMDTSKTQQLLLWSEEWIFCYRNARVLYDSVVWIGLKIGILGIFYRNNWFSCIRIMLFLWTQPWSSIIMACKSAWLKEVK